MKIKFIGPISRVTGSCSHLIDDARGAEYLVDFGLVQDEGQQFADEGRLPFDITRIRHVLLTHAHIDHCGMIPYLYKVGYQGFVWCTKGTAEIAKVSLHDAARIGDALRQPMRAPHPSEFVASTIFPARCPNPEPCSVSDVAIPRAEEAS